MRGKGFTLIEVLVYLGLFAVIAGGAVASAESLIESGGRSTTEAMLEEEGDFLTGKIDWTLSGAEFFNAPGMNTTGTTLSVSKWVAPNGNPVNVFGSAGALRMSEGDAASEPLNNSDVSLSAAAFTHTYAGGDNPESISASFTLSAKTPNGMTVSKTFATVGYLKK